MRICTVCSESQGPWSSKSRGPPQAPCPTGVPDLRRHTSAGKAAGTSAAGARNNPPPSVCGRGSSAARAVSNKNDKNDLQKGAGRQPTPSRVFHLCWPPLARPGPRPRLAHGVECRARRREPLTAPPHARRPRANYAHTRGRRPIFSHAAAGSAVPVSR